MRVGTEDDPGSSESQTVSKMLVKECKVKNAVDKKFPLKKVALAVKL